MSDIAICDRSRKVATQRINASWRFVVKSTSIFSVRRAIEILNESRDLRSSDLSCSRRDLI